MKKAIITLLVFFWGVCTAYGQISGQTELDDHPSDVDLVPMVDVSDTTMAGTGTNKKIEIHNFYKRDIEHVTSGTKTLDAEDNSKMFTNSEATGDVTFSILECTSTTEGFWASFYVLDTTYDMYIDPHANDSIANVSPNENGEYIYGDQTVGSVVSVTCMKGDDGDYDIYTTGHSGTWTAQD